MGGLLITREGYNHCPLDKIQTFFAFISFRDILVSALRGDRIFEKRTQRKHTHTHTHTPLLDNRTVEASS